MQTVYVNTPGTIIKRSGRVLRAYKEKDLVSTIFPFRTRQLVLGPGVELTRPAINLLLAHGISTVFLNKIGHYNGQLVPPLSKNVFLRMKQYRRQDEPAFALSFAKTVVKAKLTSQMILLQRIRRFQNRDISGADQRIRELTMKVEEVQSLEQLRGLEGMGSKLFFAKFNLGFTQNQKFKKRVRRPPTDPVNAVLSLLYTFLYYRVDEVVERRGLDPYLGHLHELAYGRHSLVLDLIEEFRPIVVDPLVLSLFNLKILAENDFVRVEPEVKEVKTEKENSESQPDVLADELAGFSEQSGNLPPVYREGEALHSSEDDGHDQEATAPPVAVLLSKDAMDKVVRAFERKLDTTFSYKPSGGELTYRRAFEAQVEQYIALIDEETAAYLPLNLS